MTSLYGNRLTTLSSYRHHNAANKLVGQSHLEQTQEGYQTIKLQNK